MIIHVGTVIPPGYAYNGTSTKACGDGSYRKGWRKTTLGAVNCTSCGLGINSTSEDTPVAVLDTDGKITYINVAGSPEACCKYSACGDMVSHHYCLPQPSNVYLYCQYG
jgi:hypothetical protein